MDSTPSEERTLFGIKLFKFQVPLYEACSGEIDSEGLKKAQEARYDLFQRMNELRIKKKE
jgi:hypothetical protein